MCYEGSARLDDIRAHVTSSIMCEFADGKFVNAHSYYDRISLARQLAKGWLQTRIVKFLVGQMEKRLH